MFVKLDMGPYLRVELVYIDYIHRLFMYIYM